jgi:meckelin
VTLQTDDVETKNVDESIRMFPPHLIIEYDQQLVSTVPRVDLDVGEKLEDMRYPKVEFRSRYTMQLDYFWNVMLGVGIAWIILMVIWAGIKLSVRQQSQSMTWNGIAADIVGSTADWLFSGMFLVSAYWFCFFKLQSEVESLLPLENPHPSFLVCVVVAGWCKIIHVALLIFGQCNIDLFFIDFEPGSVKEKERRGGGHKGEDEEGGALPQVSVWRSIVIANEWNEMQTERHTDIDFTLIFLLFFLRGLDLINLDTPQPVEQDLSEDVPNIVLRFFVICSFYLVVVLAQGIYKMVDYRYAFDPLDTFCALCQHANISVFILDEALHGYYIHGKSVHPSTDVNMMQLQANLRDEANNKTQASGLSRKTPEARIPICIYIHVYMY